MEQIKNQIQIDNQHMAQKHIQMNILDTNKFELSTFYSTKNTLEIKFDLSQKNQDQKNQKKWAAQEDSSFKTITNLSLQEIANFFKKLKNQQKPLKLTQFSLFARGWGWNNDQITDQGIIQLLQAISQITSLKVLELGFRSWGQTEFSSTLQITDLVFNDGFNCLKNLLDLEEIYLNLDYWGNNNLTLTNQDLISFFENLSVLQKLKSITISADNWLIINSYDIDEQNQIVDFYNLIFNEIPNLTSVSIQLGHDENYAISLPKSTTDSQTINNQMLAYDILLTINCMSKQRLLYQIQPILINNDQNKLYSQFRKDILYELVEFLFY
ncbi:hypothetical protein PPERSA_11561 [Pseudocohnilembus persalinus]|uniref:Uncharacterized protein n=1 Tax=Pseudocohnilembus persalinus TaxID=266149 RepID=A0A0V0Q7D5_PSEPJ|nr:hypothetical protein PPERSA_11561 [Pseudocohnilembus persalinus]|eukprot:KRW98128.1 hypothetical protein PPERSA_11561 [Pseudocohnilembus persalinus]